MQGFILDSIGETERCPSYSQIIDVRKNKQKSTDGNVTITQRGALSVTQTRGQHHAEAFSKGRKIKPGGPSEQGRCLAEISAERRRILRGERGLWGRNRTQFGNHGIAQGRVLLGLMRGGDIRTEHWTWNQKTKV